MIESYPTGEECRYNGHPHPLVERLPYYKYVPKEPQAHKAWRIRVRSACGELTEDGKRFTPLAKARQKKMMEACRDDPLLFINLFGWLSEPREGESVAQGIIPFVTWANQDPVIASIAYYWGKRHIVGDKSRAQGASWIMVYLIVWSFIFRKNSYLGLGSKDEETADDPSDPMSLGWKIDFAIRMLPRWMRPSSYGHDMEKWKDRKRKSWKNPDNGSFIKAFSATSGIGRGGRFTTFFLDESAFFPTGDREAVANLLETTNCLVMISTPNGMDNEHYDRVHHPSVWLKVVLDWRDNPYHSRGLYTAANGSRRIIDTSYEFPDHYKFILDGRIRSPWFDDKWFAHNENALYIDQELNREYQGSKGRPFPQAALNRAREHCRPALHTGMLFFNNSWPDELADIYWEEGEAYKFDLWLPLDRQGNLPRGRYVVGADICAGTGGDLSSNSVLSIWDTDRKEQIGECAVNTMDPVEFAQLAVAVCAWLGHGEDYPYLAWERQGPGIYFAKEIRFLGYPNVYGDAGKDERYNPTRIRKPGYYNADRNKTISPLKSAIVNGTATVRSHALVDECGQFIYNDQGKPEHPRSKTSRDGSSRGESHGDRVIAAAIALRALEDRTPIRRQHKNMNVNRLFPEHSMGARLAKFNEKIGQKSRSNCIF